uniref:UBX domain-containing protein n=1 Tax=Nelumbo nucifera TaxID=4432 RepID=A0A822ZD22_NELNU|nr:TPA_asm: hypothetical protein HUJ06_015638 [Nelumbo nucifera]
MDFSNYRGGSGGNKRDAKVEAERVSSRASDEEENGLTRKKLRLSKERSAFLEESFKEHNTLNPVSRNPERERERERAGSLCYFLTKGGGGARGRFPDGRRIQRNFLHKDPIQLLWSFCYSQLEETGARSFRLVQSYKQFQGIQSSWIMSKSSRLLSLDRPSGSASKLDRNPSSSLR